jgi:Mrp family chromosome partitioning ATPase
MSRTFEVLRKVQQDQELFSIPRETNVTISESGPTNGKASALDLDAFAREEFRGLVHRLFLGGGEKSTRHVVFCGVDEGSGSSWICANASRSLAAESSLPVCAVDANLRNPVLHKFLPLEKGLAAPSLPGDCEFARHVTENLWLVCGDSLGTNGDGRSLRHLQLVLGDLRGHFKYVLIDAPPIEWSKDAAILGQWADGIVLVLEAHSTRRAVALKAKQLLDTANVQLLGTVLNNRTFPIPEKIYRWL